MKRMFGCLVVLVFLIGGVAAVEAYRHHRIETDPAYRARIQMERERKEEEEKEVRRRAVRDLMRKR